MKSVLIAVFLTCKLCAPVNSIAQEKVHSNGIYAELAGNLYYYSVNYERLFPDQMIGKFGVSIVPEATSFTLMVGKIYGKGKHHLEVSGGMSYVKNTEKHLRQLEIQKAKSFLTCFVGYRYQSSGQRMFYRIGLTPLLKMYDTDRRYHSETILWGGASIGYRF